MKNIVLFGGSNSVMVNGLQAGLKEYANVTNLALGGSSAIQNLYELHRERNQEAIKNADLIVTESNVNDIIQHNGKYERLSLNIILRNLFFFYSSLYNLNKKICVIVLPLHSGNNFIKINNIHRYFANLYSFNIIDLDYFYEKKNLTKFELKFGVHQMEVIYRYLGKNIAKNIELFGKLNKTFLKIELPKFKIITPNEMLKHGDFKIFNPKNSSFDEICYRLEINNYLSFESFFDWQIIGMHSWVLEIDGKINRLGWHIATTIYAPIIIGNKGNQIRKHRSSLNQFCEIQEKIVIKNDSFIKYNNNIIINTEFGHASYHYAKNAIKLPYFDLIGILICSPYDEKTLINIDEIPDNEIIKINPELDFTHLVPNVEFFRDSMEFIDEYAPRLYGGIERHIQAKFINAQNAKIANLENENRILKSTFCTATKRVQNYLSYKLGKAMIENSKSVFGHLKMPFVLWCIKKDHKLTQKINEILSLPKIETLSDYKEAIKYKNHLSYKLGAAMIKASKAWYKGGFVKLFFEIQKIKKEHKKK